MPFFLISSRIVPGSPLAVSPVWEFSIGATLALVVLWVGWKLSRALQRRTGEWQASEERLRSLFENAVEGIYESSPGGGFTRVNPALARILGFASPAELLKLTPEAAAGLYLLPRRRDEFFTALGAGDHVANFESEVRRPDDTTAWISENVRAVRDPAGKLLSLQGFISDITARKRADLARRASEERSRVVFEHSPVAIVEYDYRGMKEWLEGLRAQGVTDLGAHFDAHPEVFAATLAKTRLSAVNDAAVRLLGARSAQELAANQERIYTPAALDARRSNLLALWRGEHRNEGEVVLCGLDGVERRVVHRWWMPLVDGVLGYQWAQTALIDITAIRDAETALRASEERFRVLFQHSPIGLVEYDYRPTVIWLEGLRAGGVSDLDAWLREHPDELEAATKRIVIAGANSATLRLVGAKSVAEGAANLARVFTPGTLAARRQIFLALWESRNAVEGEFEIRSLDGASRRVYFSWWLPTIEGRAIYERTQLALVDLTEIRSAEHALAAERERLSVTLRAMTESVVTTNPAGVVQFMNDAAGELTGWTTAAAVGRPLAEIFTFGAEKAGRPIAAPVAAALAADRPVDLPPQTVLRPRKGGPRRVEGRCAPMHDVGGRVIGVVLVVRDVTDRSRLEEELMRASKLESIGVLAGGIAHDFNNLLAIVMGNLTLALLDEKVLAAGGRWLREAERGTLRARELTQQLLTFAKGGEPLKSAVLLPDVVREAAEFALHGAAARCEFEIASNLRPADADKGQIGQVVQNLVINAVQAMPSGGVIRLKLCNETLAAGAVARLPAGDYLRLEITDTGKGIAPEQLGHIFEPFFTTKEHGTGLGLATVYSVIQKHSGHITVESIVGQGTTFRLWLPAARVEPLTAAQSASPFERLRGRVLFMDDEEPIRAMTKMLLERLGLEPTVTSDGGEAVRAYAVARKEGKPFDLVIMDLTVPGGMSGAEAMREILKIDPAARGIVSSGYSSDPVMANYRAHGFRGMVPKPYRLNDFARAIREVMSAG